MVQIRSILVGKADFDRLMRLIGREAGRRGGSSLLYDELDSATVVQDPEALEDVVVMGSSVTFFDVDEEGTSTIELVYPDMADTSRNRVSILAPVGAALIGLKVGESITWPLPTGKVRTLKVVSVAHPSAGSRSGESRENAVKAGSVL